MSMLPGWFWNRSQIWETLRCRFRNVCVLNVSYSISAIFKCNLTPHVAQQSIRLPRKHLWSNNKHTFLQRTDRLTVSCAPDTVESDQAKRCRMNLLHIEWFKVLVTSYSEVCMYSQHRISIWVNYWPGLVCRMWIAVSSSFSYPAHVNLFLLIFDNLTQVPKNL